jgi:hypothetical protein
MPIEPALSVQVPAGTAPRVNGRLSEGEWNQALALPLSDGGHLYLMHAGGYLYLALRGDPEGVASICHYQDGEVSILHASAGYTTAYYTRDADEWRMRTMIIGSYTMQLPESLWQEQHLEDHGWTASLFDDGDPGEYEYQIDLQGGEPLLAAAYVYGYGDGTFLDYETWPAQTGDDCGRMEIAAIVPDVSRLRFSPESWVKLVMVEE